MTLPLSLLMPQAKFFVLIEKIVGQNIMTLRVVQLRNYGTFEGDGI